MFSLNSTELFLLGSSLFCLIILALYCIVIYARPLRAAKRFNNNDGNDNKPPVSIIIYAKNDSENLKRHLPALLSQDYPDYQVIVINDGSTDETDDTLKFLQNQYNHLYVTYIPSEARYLSHRKLALTLGVKAAEHDILIFTEANCQPLSDQWLSAMVSGYKKETSIVLGFCKYGNHKGLFQKLVAYDNLQTGLRYLSFAISAHPYIGNGRNLSYRKELFFKNKGYYQTLNLHAGDDDLFVNEVSNKDNTNAVYSADSITEMDKIESFRIWKEMKISRAATQQYYKGGALRFFYLESICFTIFQLSSIALAVCGFYGKWTLSVIAILLYILRFSIKAAIFGKSAKMLRQTPSIGWLFILELILPLFNIQAKVYRFFRGSKDYTFNIGN